MADEPAKICGAQLRNKPGRVCQIRHALSANGRCRLHGGTSLRGIASATYKHGRRTRYGGLPPRMKHEYQRALSDPQLLELKEEIALIHARAADLVRRVDSGESGHLWHLLQAAYRTLTTAQSGADQLTAIREMGTLISRGAADYRAWQEVLSTITTKQRLIESERKRAIELHQTITLDALNPFIHAIIDYIRRTIPDHDRLMEFQRILEAYAHVTTALEDDPEEEGEKNGPPTTH
jgi:hypothetical protein